MPNVLSYKTSLEWGGVAGATLTPYTGVVVNYETGAVTYPASQGDRCDGVVLDSADSGEPVKVIIDGIIPVKIKTAGTIIKGDKLMVATDGGFLEATTGEVATAEALMAAGANGDIILARLIEPVVVA